MRMNTQHRQQGRQETYLASKLCRAFHQALQSELLLNRRDQHYEKHRRQWRLIRIAAPKPGTGIEKLPSAPSSSWPSFLGAVSSLILLYVITIPFSFRPDTRYHKSISMNMRCAHTHTRAPNLSKQRRVATITAAATSEAPPRAAARTARAGNVAGSFWVDTTCIDCDLCRRLSESFTRLGSGSVVSRQPETAERRVAAMQALLSCPTSSIHAETVDKRELKAAQQGMPILVPGCQDVYYCGWNSEKSFSASSYLIRRDAGNVMVDTPRYNPVLARKLQEMGGVSCIFLTHKDDVGDHAAWSKHFGCPRVMHATEIGADTRDVEVQLQGSGPWDLTGAELRMISPSTPSPPPSPPPSPSPSPPSTPMPSPSPSPPPSPSSGSSSGAASGAAADATIVFTPGHTSGHCCLYYAPDKALFSGDHLSQEDSVPDLTPGAKLNVFTDFNWYSVPMQLGSVDKLRRLDFLTVLPGHGRMARFGSTAERDGAIDALLELHRSKVAAGAG